MNISRNVIIKSLFWKFFEKVGSQLISFIITILLARLLMPEQYGIIALITVFINLCNIIIDGGLTTALIQKKEADNIDFSSIFYFSIVVSVILYVLLFISAPLISSFYGIPTLSDVIRVLALNLPIYAFNSVQRAYVSRKMLFDKLFYSSFASVVISGLLGVLLAYNGAGIWALVIQSIISNVIICVIMWYTIRWRPLAIFSYTRFVQLFNYGWKIFLSNIIIVIFVELRKLLIGKLYLPSNLAYFERGEQFPNLLMNNIFASIQAVLLPTFADYQDDKISVKSMMRRSTKLSCFFIYPLTIGLITVAEPLVRFLLTDKWINVVPFIQILSISNIFRPITISNLEAIKALGYSNIVLKLEAIKKVIDIIILLISVKLGVLYIAWGVVIYNFICIFINLAPIAKLLGYKISDQLLDTLPSLIISIMMGVMVYSFTFLNISDEVLLILQIIGGALIYLLLCKCFKEENLSYVYNLICAYFKKRKS